MILHNVDQDARLGVDVTPRSQKSAGRGSAIRHLYHLADADNLQSILAQGLLSTRRLLQRSDLSPGERTAILRGHRRSNLTLPSGVLIRDQRPMPPLALAPALDDGLTPEDWYALLNSHVFLWPDQQRMNRQRKACGPRPQFVLTFDAGLLLEHFADHVFLSPINSGNAPAQARPTRPRHASGLPRLDRAGMAHRPA